jgi:hypothetical protein
VAVYTRLLPSSGLDLPFVDLSPAEVADIRSRIDAFGGIAAYGLESRNLTRGEAEAERVLTMKVSAGFSGGARADAADAWRELAGVLGTISATVQK